MGGRILALDVGERRIGVAISDPLGLTAQRLPVLARRTPAADFDALESLVTERQVERIVVGLPLTLSGDRGSQAKRVEAFAQALRRRVTVPVQLVDERLTTSQGQRTLLSMDVSRRKRKQQIDAVAAQLILQQYLDTERQKTTQSS
jgi:putative Holliday junction resolvase